MSAIRFMKGRVTVRADGAQIEKLINAAAAKGAKLYDVRRLSSRSMIFAIDYSDFFHTRTAFRDAGCRIRIIRRGGIPHLRSRLRARAAFSLGAVLCFIALMALTQLVWDVRVIGEMDIEQRSIANETLESMNIRRGMFRGAVDAREISDRMNENIDGLTFVGARMRGLTLEVEIVPSGQPPEMVAHDVPADIVAEVDGIVERVMVLEGTAAVRAGQEVRAGDVLIEGRAVGPGGEVEVHALGEVILRVWVRGEGEAPLYRKVTEPTGRYVNRSTLVICGYPLPVHGDIPYEEYAVASRKMPILPGLYLPAALVTETLHEVEVSQLPRDEMDVQREAEQSAILSALEMLKADTTIVDKRVEFSKMKDTTLYAAVRLQILRSAGVERERVRIEGETD